MHITAAYTMSHPRNSTLPPCAEPHRLGIALPHPRVDLGPSHAPPTQRSRQSKVAVAAGLGGVGDNGDYKVDVPAGAQGCAYALREE